MKYIRLIVLISVLGLLQACGTSAKSVSYDWNTSNDPLEGLNRSIHSFNDKADKYVLRPLASGYSKVVPAPAKKGVTNFFSNLGEPLSVVNNLLQGKLDRALGSTYRFTVNSTIGLLGLIDVAKYQGVDKAPEDLGQTLATWGVKPGPYLVLPFLGPSNLRDGFGRAISQAAYYPAGEISDDAATRFGLFAVDSINSRAALLGVDSAIEKQLDPYVFIKNVVESSRTDAINDGQIAEAEEFDF